jgi:hypothetical protein
MRWTGRYSRRETCSNCKRPFIVLHDSGETCQVAAASADAVGEMVCDWLGPRLPADDDDTPGGTSEPERRAG